MVNVQFDSIEDYNCCYTVGDYHSMVANGATPEEALKELGPKSRDNARTPYQWDASENAGFTTGKPWLKINGNYKKVNVAADQADPNGVFAFWKYMVALRKQLPALIDGDFVPVLVSGNIFAFERTLNGKRLLSVCNMTGKEVKLPGQLSDWSQVLACNYDDVTDTMRPFEFRLMEEEIDDDLGE